MNKEKIRSKYCIEETEIGDIKKIIKKKMSEAHSDNYGGDFPNEESKAKFLSIKADYEYLCEEENFEQNNLTVTTKDIIALIREIVPNNKNVELVEKLNTQISENRMVYRKKNKERVIPSSIITAILSGIFLFPNQIKDHPILSLYISIESPIFIVIWIYSIVVTIFILLNAWSCERKTENIMANLKSESYQNMIFQSFIMSNTKFSKRDIFEFCQFGIINPNRRMSLIPFTGTKSNISDETLDCFIDCIIERMTKKGIIELQDILSIDDYYHVKTNLTA